MTRPLAPHQLDALVLYAARYALGRMTYAVEDVVLVIEARAADLSPKTRDVLARDIREAEARGGLGMEMDAKRWRDALRVLTEGR